MNTFKKTIFLSNSDKNNGMAILSLELKNNNIFGLLKIYNSTINGDYILGIKFDDKVLKQNVNLRDNTYNFIITDKVSLSSSIGCALIETDGKKFEPILWGNEKNINYKSSIVSSLKDSINKLNINKSLQKNAMSIEEAENKKQETFDVYSPIKSSEYKDSQLELSQISLQEEIINNQSEIAVASNTASLFESSKEEIDNIIESEIDKIERGNHKFYDMLSDQLKELFDTYPREYNLSKLIDNSEWVKINSDNDNKYYVVGIIRHKNDIKYICYGVPGNYNIEPPIEMRDYSQWLPADTLNPYSNGYWVMYQDADTGDNIFIN